MQSTPPTPAPAPKKGIPGWLLVLFIVLGCFVAFGGVLSVLAIYGVRKYIAAAKQAEARNSLGMIAKDAAEAYQARTSGGPGGHTLCPSASRSVPATAAAIRGTKYQSAPADWMVDSSRNGGFACLQFSMDLPQYYMYSYHAAGRGSPGGSFEATANGDLNGDGILSTFTLTGRVQPDGELAVAPSILETNPRE
jgi:type IV pilus assembly protein PilA